jgi:hypothetical protein
MRHQYTPIFRDLLDSSLWASATPATRCVWITFLLDADPEGYVATSIPGLARRANVTVQAARAAIDMLEAPDPDSRTPDHQGRRVKKVAGGWKVLNFVAKRELAKHEAEKARKRRWANANGKRPPVANDNNEAPSRLGLDASSETLDAPKPKPKPKPSLSEERSSPTPPPVAPQDSGDTLPAVLRKLPEGYQASEGLRFKAQLAGVKRLDHWLDKLRLIPIGGKSGILPHKLEEWLEQQVSTWRKWEETDAFKDANSRAAAAPPGRFQGGGLPVAGPARERVQGAADWVYVEHATFARKSGLDINRAARAFAKGYHLPVRSLHPPDLFAPFMKYLENLAAERAEEASA